MGYMRHHAIVVSSWDKDLIAKAHKIAVESFPHVSEIVPHAMNGGGSFLVPPDGSKEGWPESLLGDDRRAAFVRWMDSQRYDDGSTSLRWVEVMYADDDGDAKIISRDDVSDAASRREDPK